MGEKIQCAILQCKPYRTLQPRAEKRTVSHGRKSSSHDTKISILIIIFKLWYSTEKPIDLAIGPCLVHRLFHRKTSTDIDKKIRQSSLSPLTIRQTQFPRLNQNSQLETGFITKHTIRQMQIKNFMQELGRTCSTGGFESGAYLTNQRPFLKLQICRV